ncbi:D-hexose-6-phosphate mutarotase [Thalassotalea piscium]
MSHMPLFSNEHGEITQYQKAEGIDIINIQHHLCSASVSLYGGQVLTWQLKGQQPVFWLSDASLYQTGKAIRGGIPLCWPWFGDYKDGGNHGFARTMQWQLIDAEITEDAVVLTLSTAGEKVSPLWSSPFKLLQKLTFSTEFTQALTIDNVSELPVKFSSALHSYFQVSSPLYTTVARLNNVQFDDKITSRVGQQDVRENCLGPLDRIYYNHDIQQIKDTGWQRIIEVESKQCGQWVLWNPGQEIAKTMADIHVGGELEYICLEAANTQWQTLPPHESVTLAQRISIIPL